MIGDVCTVCVCVGVCVFPPESLSLATSKPQVTWSFPNFIIVTKLVALDCENLPIPDLNPNSTETLGKQKWTLSIYTWLENTYYFYLYLYRNFIKTVPKLSRKITLCKLKYTIYIIHIYIYIWCSVAQPPPTPPVDGSWFPSPPCGCGAVVWGSACL